jgi:thiamine kinase-like enzyme
MYNGETNAQGIPNGKGKMTTPTYIYEGDFVNGKFQGYGSIIYPRRTKIGSWKNNKLNGEGTLTLDNGVSYQGIWNDDFWVRFSDGATEQPFRQSLDAIIETRDPRYVDYNRYMIQSKQNGQFRELYRAIFEKVQPRSHEFYTNPMTTAEMQSNQDKMSNIAQKTNTSRLYRHGDVLVKTQKDFTEKKSLTEAFVNLVIITPYLDAHPNTPLVPCFGFFICPIRGLIICPTEYQFPDEEEEETDEPRDDREPHLFLIQKNQPGIPFYQWVRGKSISSIHRLMVQLFSCLKKMQESQYHLIHNDLHGGNVIVSPDGSRCWIIDWGEASFTYQGMRYSTSYEQGAWTDVIKLIETIRTNSSDSVHEWMNVIFERIRVNSRITYDGMLDILLEEAPSPLGKKSRRSKRKKSVNKNIKKNLII